MNQQANGNPVGFLNPALYALAQTGGYGIDFHDITSGNNFDSYSPALYSAVTGYDLVTGLGTPAGQSLIDALAPANSSPNFTLAVSPSAITVNQGDQTTSQISLAAHNGFSGSVSLKALVIGSPSGITAGLSQSSITAGNGSTLTVSASSSVSAASTMIGVVGTSGSITQTIYLPVTVALPNVVETSVSGLPASLQPGATFQVTDTTENNGQIGAGGSVTDYYLSDSQAKAGIYFPVGSRTVSALPASASSTGSATATVPSNLWPNTPYYLVACANDTNSVAQGTSNNCVATSATAAYTKTTTATTTMLKITSGGQSVSTVAAGSEVVFTATVQQGASPLSPGQVNFCDAAAAHCTDVHLIGTTQLKSNGTATLRLIPGIGAHSCKAVFAGTVSASSSSSTASSLNVTGARSTTTSISSSGSVGDYSPTATVTGLGGAAAPSGEISFLNTSNSDALVASGTLVAQVPALGWLNSQNPSAGSDSQGVAIADFNNDGIPDLAVANRNDGTVSIFLGKGDGTFTAGTTVHNIYSAQAMLAADFNGDGKIDLPSRTRAGIQLPSCSATATARSRPTHPRTVRATYPPLSQWATSTAMASRIWSHRIMQATRSPSFSAMATALSRRLPRRPSTARRKAWRWETSTGMGRWTLPLQWPIRLTSMSAYYWAMAMAVSPPPARK